MVRHRKRKSADSSSSSAGGDGDGGVKKHKNVAAKVRLVADSSSGGKFWEAVVSGCECVVRFGRITSSGSTQVKTFGSEAEAQKYLEKMMKSKLRKGYLEAEEDVDADKLVAAPRKKPVARTVRGAAAAAAASAAGAASDEVYLTCPSATGGKMWSVSVDGCVVTIHFGSLKGNPRTQLKEFGTPAEAEAYKAKQVAAKLKKGYTAGEAKQEEGEEDEDDEEDDDDADEDGDEVMEGQDEEEGASESVYLTSDSNSAKGKFWSMDVDGNTTTVSYGKIGSNGRTQTKEFGSAAEAKAYFDKQVAAKLKKGYSADAEVKKEVKEEEEEGDEEEEEEEEEQQQGGASKVYLVSDSKSASGKFWSIEQDGSSTTVAYGKIGSNGRKQTKKFASAGEAKAYLDKQVAAKLKKGYSYGGLKKEEEDGDGEGDVKMEDAPAQRSVYLVSDSNSASGKFWKMEQNDSSTIVTYGKIGSNGRKQTKDFASTADASTYFDKQVAAKLKKGYHEARDGDDDDDDDDVDMQGGSSSSAAASSSSSSSAPSKRYLTMSTKFWSISTSGSSVTIHYGKLNTKGRTQTKQFKSAAEAQAYADKQVAAKLKKGYSEEAGDGDDDELPPHVVVLPSTAQYSKPYADISYLECEEQVYLSWFKPDADADDFGMLDGNKYYAIWKEDGNTEMGTAKLSTLRRMLIEVGGHKASAVDAVFNKLCHGDVVHTGEYRMCGAMYVVALPGDEPFVVGALGEYGYGVPWYFSDAPENYFANVYTFTFQYVDPSRLIAGPVADKVLANVRERIKQPAYVGKTDFDWGDTEVDVERFPQEYMAVFGEGGDLGWIDAGDGAGVEDAGMLQTYRQWFARQLAKHTRAAVRAADVLPKDLADLVAGKL